MRYSKNMKPIRYLKANTAEEDLQTLAMLKLVAIGRKEIAEGKHASAADVIKRMQKIVEAK